MSRDGVAAVLWSARPYWWREAPTKEQLRLPLQLGCGLARLAAALASGIAWANAKVSCSAVVTAKCSTNNGYCIISLPTAGTKPCEPESQCYHTEPTAERCICAKATAERAN